MRQKDLDMKTAIYYTESRPELEFSHSDCKFSYFNGVLTIDATRALSYEAKADYDNYPDVQLFSEREKDAPTERWKYLCKNTKVIVMRGNITDIAYPFFCHFIQLHTIVFPEALQDIGFLNFVDCPNLKYLYLPKNVKGVNGLRDKNSLLYIDVSEANENFASVNGYLMSKDKKKLIAAPGALDVVKIPDGCEEICSEALTNSHTKIVIPASVAKIDSANFHSDNLKEILLGDCAKQKSLIQQCFDRKDSLKDEFKDQFNRIVIK